MHIGYKGILFELVDGDIAIQETDAVVTAAHWRLNGGTGTDGTIHSKGGKEILAACEEIGGCPIGDAVVTMAGQLPATYVIHAVGPVWSSESSDDYLCGLLRSAYTQTLHRAAELKIKSVSIPSISTGAFAFPYRMATNIAIEAILEWVESAADQGKLERIRLVSYTREFADSERIISDTLRAAIALRIQPQGA